jgi:iron complex transport system substrate-binding protein
MSLLMSVLVLQAICPAPSRAEAADTSGDGPVYVTVRDSDGNEVTVPQNPKIAAIYDYAVLDILHNTGFEKTGIERLIVPSKDTLPADLAYYKNLGSDRAVTGGTLFYVDWDVLDLLKPELVILGGRSFGMDASGARLLPDDAAKYRSDTLGRYPAAAFLKLAMNSSDSRLTEDIKNNVSALSAVFPAIAGDLAGSLDEIENSIAGIRAKARASGKKALFCMMVDQKTLAVFNPKSRFDMIYEDFGFSPADENAVSWTNQHGFDVRAEYVLEKNPDVIFLLDRSATVGSGAGAGVFRNDPIIRRTKASQNGDIYVLTGDAWYTMTGGFSAARRMIEDIEQYINKLE